VLAKINFKRGDSQLKKADGSRSLLANPWIQHFRSACTTQVVASGDVQKNDASTSQALDVAGNNAIFCGTATSNSNQIHARYYQYLCHQDSADSNTGTLRPQLYFGVFLENSPFCIVLAWLVLKFIFL
jgi:hypothetical protein